MLKSLVTGGAGFIGSHLNDALLAAGMRVVAVDNLLLGKLENIAHLEPDPNFSFVELDLLDDAAAEALFKREKPDVVFHLAANSDIAQSNANPSVDLDNTFLTTYNVLSAMRSLPARKLVFASTSAIYGDAGKRSITEDFSPLFPVSHYGAGKLASEAFISSFTENYDFQTWICRFPNVVGERATHGVIFDFINRLRENSEVLNVLGNGKQKKPYLYVKDLVEAMLFVWENAKDKLNYFNIGVESRTLVSEIAEMVVAEMGLSGKTRIQFGADDRGWVGDVPEFDYKLDKIHALGWTAKISSNDAVGLAIRAILEND